MIILVWQALHPIIMYKRGNTMQANQLCVLIPSLEPDERLPKYIDSLLAADFGLVLVVNDGSGPEYDGIFEEIAGRERCHVLRHEVNRGKGQGLRTGIEYIRDHTDLAGVITADADGQHTAPDTLKLAAEMQIKKRQRQRTAGRSFCIGCSRGCRRNLRKNAEALVFRKTLGNEMRFAPA